MKKGFTTLPILLAVLVFAGIAGYILFSQKTEAPVTPGAAEQSENEIVSETVLPHESQEPNVSENTIPSETGTAGEVAQPTGAESEDEFAGWKTYRNEEYGFELRYPPDYGYVFENDKWIFTEISIIQELNKYPSEFTIDIINPDTIGDAKDLGLGRTIYDPERGECYYSTPFSEERKYQTEKVGGKSICTFTIGDAGFVSRDYYIILDNNIAVRIHSAGDESQPMAPIEKILSTFKIL